MVVPYCTWVDCDTKKMHSLIGLVYLIVHLRLWCSRNFFFFFGKELNWFCPIARLSADAIGVLSSAKLFFFSLFVNPSKWLMCSRNKVGERVEHWSQCCYNLLQILRLISHLQILKEIAIRIQTHVCICMDVNMYVLCMYATNLNQCLTNEFYCTWRG